MQEFRAWEQGSGAPAHRQVVQGPLPQGARKGCEAMIANLIVVEPKHLHIAHQTKHLSQESAPAKSQGMGTRQQGAISPSSGPGPHCPAPC